MRKTRPRRFSRRARWTAVLVGTLSLAAAAAAPTVALAESDAPLDVTLDSGGPIYGAHTDGARTFKGIPYAQAPVDELRWQPPQQAKSWKEPRAATESADMCPQEAPPGGEAATNEDCLYVDVTTPRKATKEKLPVMVWLHGGGYSNGAGSQYDAQRMAERGDVIVVTVNFRLGVFGYFGHQGLEGSGNFGTADQIAALEWTNRNAEVFGGDSDNVTLFGESSGAMSTCALMTSPATQGLFDKAILSSGSCMLDWPKGTMYPKSPRYSPYSTLESTQELGSQLASTFKCDDEPVKCLREVEAKDLLPHNASFANHLSYGTELVPTDPKKAVRDGDFNNVPVISGGNHDEMRSFIGGVIMQNGAISADRYEELARNSFGEQADEVLKQYPASEYDNPSLAWATLTTDVSWGCQTLNADQQMAEHTDVFAYEFADANAPNVNGVDVPQFKQGAAHATDLPYLFDLGGKSLLDTPEQKKLAGQMIDYWTSFADNGRPSSHSAPHWSKFKDRGPVMSLNSKVEPVDFAADHKCRFWDQLES